MAKRLISIVTPCFNEEANVERHFERVRTAAAPFRERYDFEHIYTDNCSADRTFELLRGLGAVHPEVKALRFSRNIGANRAIMIGLAQARGDAAVLIQADLQDPPEVIPEFIRGWEAGYDVVYGQILAREEGALMQAVRRLYYRIVSALSDVSLPRNAGEFRLTSRRVLDAFREYGDDDPYLRGIVAHVGFPQKAVPYRRVERSGGRSSQGLPALVAYAINGLLSTTAVPIRAVIVLGFLLAALGFAMTVILVAAKFIFPGQAPHGFTTLATLITFFAGAQLCAIGIIGEYIRKIYAQSLRMPRGFIQDKINL
ncbi:MAG: glycosyltransferase family 2 protein [Elusimicrobia bacterium]|nr:glycosyltransferase family 2 protein [Elusimicrobiota bacterium]